MKNKYKNWKTISKLSFVYFQAYYHKIFEKKLLELKFPFVKNKFEIPENAIKRLSSILVINHFWETLKIL